MSNIVNLLFMVLTVLTAAASDSTDRLQFVQTRVESFFENEIYHFEEKYNTTSLTLTENSHKLLNDAESINRNVSDYKRAIWNKAKEDILELIVKTLIIGATEDCDEIVRNVDYKGRVLLSNVYSCTDRILNTAFHNIAEMKMMYERVHETLIDFRDRIDACARYFNTTEEVESAIFCTEMIETRTRPFMAESVEPVLAKIDETNNLLPTLLNSFSNCSDGYAAYQIEAANLTNRAKICYQHFIEGAAPLFVIPLETTTSGLTTP